MILTTFSPPRPSRSSPAARPSPPSASSSCSPSPPAWPSWGQSRFEETTIVKKREQFQSPTSWQAPDLSSPAPSQSPPTS